MRWQSERQRVGVGDAPLSVADYLRLCREDDDYELIDGVLVQRMAAQLPHEWLFQWMLRLVGGYVEARGLGIVLGSRTPVQINPYRVRLPDLLFVRTERLEVLTPQAITEPPDWVMEIRSAGERASDWVRLESDYRMLGVPEIWMVDLPRQRMRALQRSGDDYTVLERTEGRLESMAIDGFAVHVEHLLTETRPPVHTLLRELLEATP
ncbi:MAG: Uma2 family endonuclease [Fimbriimonadales bacterium]